MMWGWGQAAVDDRNYSILFGSGKRSNYLSGNAAFQPKKFTSYDRDANGSDEAMFRRFNRKHSRFDQPDPYDGSYNLRFGKRLQIISINVAAGLS